MAKLFSVHLSGVPGPAGKTKTDFATPGFKLGRIDKILGPGRFVVALENGERVTVQGPRILKVDTRVRVFPPGEGPLRASEGKKESGADFLRESGTQWAALLPLGFGGKKASARLKLFVEEKPEGIWGKGNRAVYFIVWTLTEKLGELQWSIYLKGRQVSLQVFAEKGFFDLDGLKELTGGVERSLKNKGFTLASPTTYLERPFKVPDGFRLNVKG